MPRKTDSSNPADWLWIAGIDLSGIRVMVESETAYPTSRSKLAEVLEKIMKAELIRGGWRLEKTHDLDRLLQCMEERSCDLAPQCVSLCDALAEVYFTDRYPGFDLDDPDWPVLREQVRQVAALLATVQSRVGGAPPA